MNHLNLSTILGTDQKSVKTFGLVLVKSQVRTRSKYRPKHIKSISRFTWQHAKTHQRPITQSRMCHCARCLSLCWSRSPAGLPKGVCPLSLGHISMQTWFHKTPCSLSPILTFAAQTGRENSTSMHDQNHSHDAQMRWTSSVSNTWSNPRRAMLRTITVVSKPIPVRNPAHSRATSKQNCVEDWKTFLDLHVQECCRCILHLRLINYQIGFIVC